MGRRTAGAAQGRAVGDPAGQAAGVGAAHVVAAGRDPAAQVGQVEGRRPVARSISRADRGKEIGIGRARDGLAVAEQPAVGRRRTGIRHDAACRNAQQRVVVADQHVHPLGDRARVGGHGQRGQAHLPTLPDGSFGRQVPLGGTWASKLRSSEVASLHPRRSGIEIVDALHVRPDRARRLRRAHAEIPSAAVDRSEAGRGEAGRRRVAHARLLGFARADLDLRTAAVDQRPAGADDRTTALSVDGIELSRLHGGRERRSGERAAAMRRVEGEQQQRQRARPVRAESSE